MGEEHVATGTIGLGLSRAIGGIGHHASIYTEFGILKGAWSAVHIHTYSIVQYKSILEQYRKNLKVSTGKRRGFSACREEARPSSDAVPYPLR